MSYVKQNQDDGQEVADTQKAEASKRKLRDDLTAEEKARLEKYGAIDFKSAGATRKR